ncbi:MAG: hypothetical protein CVU48_08655 [Candidatus Cloacimonetes bacterium HGW-Cloacimonetes-1]|jgi:hypothetical protein|nr:MAG: hypothetical protein CVU48_08655 [Candidatus Cloacimonetes bacterium HGW-Cloacimonetes-1]
MKKVLIAVIITALAIGTIHAKEMVAGPQRPTLVSDHGQRYISTREVPPHQFSVAPVSIMESYYDYMVGNYNGLPLYVVPESAGGGYMLTYHGARTNSTASTARRVYYAYISNTGSILGSNEITNFTNREGYSTLAVDPISGKPLYAWHTEVNGSAAVADVQFTSDAFIDGLTGLFNDFVYSIDNTITITSPSGVTSTNNEFIWPTTVIGPSPVAGKRRVYVVGRNYVSGAVGAPSENPYFAFADFDGNDIEQGTQLVWSFTHIPEMDNWNADSVNWRRPFHAICVDNSGNLYYVGYHSAYVGTGADAVEIVEPDLDVFKCSNYGQGTWEYFGSNSDLPSVNPLNYFVDTNNNNLPYTNEQMRWTITNSSHLNAVVDDEGKIHCAAIWALGNTDNSYWPSFQVVKEFTFDTITDEFQIKEIYPQTADPAGVFQPWDIVAPWGDIDATDPVSGSPLFELGWPFPYWDDTAEDSAMMFHYNNTKISEANDNGQMVCVWQDSYRARQINANQDEDYAAFSNTPEIYISVTPDNGDHWSQPIVLNNVETPQFAGLKPMWVYPANKVKFTGMEGLHKKGKIGLMFYDDNTWGSFSSAPPVHPINDGGRVMFTEIEVVFPLGVANDDNSIVPIATMLQQNYPNPFNPTTTISFNMPKAGNAKLSVYNVKGQLVKTLVNGTKASGSNSVVWNGDDNSGNSVTSGIYFYKLATNGKTETRKMMLMK